MIHKRKSIRLRNWNYASHGYYFVTICVNNRQCLFGKIINNQIILNEYGKIIKFTWLDLVNHNRGILLDEFVVMPNHIHGIIIVGAGSKPALIISGAGLEPAPTALSEIVRQFKTFSANLINKLRNAPGVKLWQRNYYDHIIRNEQSLNALRAYINNNPIQWSTDKYNRFCPPACPPKAVA